MNNKLKMAPYPRIFLDMDGVIVNFPKGVIDWYDLPIGEHEVAEWGTLEHSFKLQRPGKTANDFWNGLTEKFFLGLEVYPHADKILKFLQPYRPIILSSPTWYQASAKQKWLEKYMPEYFFDGRYLLGMQKHYAAAPGHILIDDGDHNIKMWRGHGGYGLLFPQPWNEAANIPFERFMNALKVAIKAHEEGMEGLTLH